MVVIVGLVVLIVAVVVGFAGVLTNATAADPIAENFSVFGYHVTGSTGTLFLFGMVVGAVAVLGLSVLLAGARHTAGRGRNARHELDRSRRDTAYLNQQLDQRLEPQQVRTATDLSQRSATSRVRSSVFDRWSRGRRLRRATDADIVGKPDSRSDTVSPHRGP